VPAATTPSSSKVKTELNEVKAKFESLINDGKNCEEILFKSKELKANLDRIVDE